MTLASLASLFARRGQRGGGRKFDLTHCRLDALRRRSRGRSPAALLDRISPNPAG
jgi:hypothetical protein